MKLIYIAVFVILKPVFAQICNHTISVLREVPETYQYTYYEAYQGEDCILCTCIKSKMAVSIGTRMVEKNIEETVTICCEGYVEDKTYDGDGLKCVPLCNPPCGNGYCKSPNECACEAGYALDPNDDLNRCIPLCLEGCSIPDCLLTCSRYEDYDTEVDMCSGTCLNGTCTAPGICHCDPGYRRESQACEPICSSCDHGTCVAPELCKCNSGWRKECGYCQPICSGCAHGECIAPGQCECDPGYKAVNAKCVPHCSGCDNGHCFGPETCVCESGWYLNEAGTECLAHCDVACGNGTCVAPNVCECDAGYQVLAPGKGNAEAPLCKPVCNNCDWLCVAPGVCKCEGQYETIYTKVDCSDDTNCDKINCRRADGTNLDNLPGLNESEIFVSRKNLEVSSVGANNNTIIDVYQLLNGTKLYADRKSEEPMYYWIYLPIIIIELLVILLLLGILIRKDIIKRLKTRKFILPDKPNAEVAVHYTSSVTECS